MNISRYNYPEITSKAWPTKNVLYIAMSSDSVAKTHFSY